MPGPPPPPPPGGPPPPPAFNMPPPSSSGPNDRSALLKSIQKGTKLKKTVTVDKSGPMIPGKVSSVGNSHTSSGSHGGDKPQMSGAPMVNGLGGLFADGMPKLKPVKSLGLTSTSNSHPPPSNNNNFVNTQKQIKMQIKASDNKNRGPPPPAPTRNTSNSIKDYPAPKKLPMSLKNGGHNPHIPFNTSVPNLPGMHVEPNRSSLHKKTMSNTNLGSLDNTDSGVGNNNNVPPKPTNFGKPQLAPKPPPLNGKPSIRISLNRTQSMHSPRSPSPQSPGINDKMKFGTVRNFKPGFIDSLENIHQPAAPRATIAERPKAPPPSIPNTPPPPSKTVIKHPGHAPPPPPPIAAPSENLATQAPPPLPHRTPPQIPRSVPISNGSSAPVPPPRFSSMKDVGDFEARFADKFHDVSDFPSPMPFRGIDKVYLGIQVFSNKQQAPLPPNHLQLNNRLWNSSTC